MLLETACLVGFLFACGTFLILRRSFVQILFGFVILGNAANLLVLALSGSPNGKRVYVAAQFGKHYPRRSWTVPLLSALGILIGVMAVAFAVAMVAAIVSGTV